MHTRYTEYPNHSSYSRPRSSYDFNNPHHYPPPPWDPPSHSYHPHRDNYHRYDARVSDRLSSRRSTHFKRIHEDIRTNDVITVDSIRSADKGIQVHGKKRKNEEIGKKEITEKKARLSDGEVSSSPSVMIVSTEPAIDRFQELTSDITLFERENSPSKLETNVKLEYCNFLSQKVSCSIYNPRFIVFGSSLNGFSTRSSDLDITLLIEGEELYQDPLRKVYRRLRKITSKISACQLIRAKVPIVMFEDLQYGFEVDISINNDSGIRNTFLLRTYSRLDTRVRPLVIVVKEWAKANNVCNSKSGLLSSYALNLMVLFFLQHTATPQVLPSLQRMFPDIFNSYYTIDDIQKVGLNEICNSWKSENTESVGELLIKFFEFYSILDFREKLISIRTGSLHERPIWDSTKGYKGYINIEEPYTLDNAARSVYLLIRCKEIIGEFKRKHKQLMSRERPKNLETVFSFTTTY